MRRLGRVFLATAVLGGTVIGSAVAEAAAPPPAFHPYNAYDVSSWPEAVAIGDLTGDGLPDVLMSTSFYFDATADYHLWLFPQQPDGSLGVPTPILTGAAYGDDMSLEIADLDGDTDLDAAVTTTDGVEIYVQDAGDLAYSWTVPAPGARQVEAGDVNGDGLADLIVRSNEGVRAFRQVAGDFTWNAWVTQEMTYDIELGDVTGDGVADVVALSGSTIRVFPKTVSDSFGAPVTYSIGGEAPWNRGNGIALGDLTGDGLDDVAATISGNSPNSKVSILAQEPDGTLGVANVLSSYDIPETAEAADVNSDGLTDLVVLHGGWNRAGVYLQQDDGTLSGENLYPIPYASHYNVDGLAVGDVTGDGQPDLAIADYNQGLVVLRSAGPGADVTPPNTTITGGSSGTQQSRTASFTFTSTEPGTFECRMDNGPWGPCTSPKTYTGLTEGTHVFNVRATDTAGNVDTTPASRVVTVAGPDTTITSGPTGTVRSTGASFAFTGGAGTTGFECSLGGAAFAPCASPKTYSGLATGSSQTFRVRAVGADGLVDSTPATRSWTIEAAADLTTSLTVPATVKRNATTTYTLTVRNTGPAAAAGVTTTQGLPSGLTFQSVTTTAGTCTSTGNPATVHCTVGSLASGATVTIKVVAKATVNNNTVLTSTAVASSTSWDPDPSDNAASATTKVSNK